MTVRNSMILKQMELGPMQNFTYLIVDPQTKAAAVVDPGWDIDAVRLEEKNTGCQIRHVLLTHGHFDHVQGVEELLTTHDVPVYLSRHEPPYYTLSFPALKTTSHDDIILVGKLPVRCLHTPGHTPGSQCFFIEGNLLTGDTLFNVGCGRCDLPGGDAAAMYRSLHEVILKLPEDTVVWPGHRYGPAGSMTLKELRKVNPTLRFGDEEAFIQELTGA